MEALLKLQECSSDKARRLRMIYDHINVYVRSLEALGATSEQYETLLILLIMSRPKNSSLQIARQVSKDARSIMGVLNVIQEEVDSTEMSEKRKEGLFAKIKSLSLAPKH